MIGQGKLCLLIDPKKKCEQIYLYYTHIITKVINPLHCIIPPSDIRRLYVWPLLQYVMLCQNCSLWSLPVSSISSSWSHYKYHPLSCMSFYLFFISLSLSLLYIPPPMTPSACTIITSFPSSSLSHTSSHSFSCSFSLSPSFHLMRNSKTKHKGYPLWSRGQW